MFSGENSAATDGSGAHVHPAVALQLAPAAPVELTTRRGRLYAGRGRGLSEHTKVTSELSGLSHWMHYSFPRGLKKAFEPLRLI